MSWRDRLQPASIRGVGFYIDTASGQAGRRVAVHEYPQQEESWAEDLGKKAGSQSLQAFLVGADYDLARDALFDALDKSGPSTLVHPYLGTLKVQVTDYDWSISTRQGGYCKVTINYVPAGKREYPLASAANAQALSTASANASRALQSAFVEAFAVVGMPAWVSDAALDQLTDVVDLLKSVNGMISNALQPLSDAADQIEQLRAGLGVLLGSPASLASQLFERVSGTLSGATTIGAVMDSYSRLLTGVSSRRAVAATTPNRQAQATNQFAVQHLIGGAATVAIATQIADSTLQFETFDHAMQTRDTLLTELDMLIESGDDLTYNTLVELQTHLMRRINDAATDLLRIDHIQLEASIPALVLAHQVYGDATRADELATRNSLSNPNFLPTGMDIEVLL